MPRTLTRKRNDTIPFSGTLKKGGAAKDIENATLRFHMFKTDGSLVIDAAASNDQTGDGSDGTKGNWSYTPAASEVDESGDFDAEVEVTYADGTIETFPERGYNRVTIGDDLA